MGDWVHTVREPQRLRTTRRQCRIGYGIPTRKQRHVVTHIYQGFSQVRDDSLSPTVKLRRNTLIQWRNLRDPHRSSYGKSLTNPSQQSGQTYYLILILHLKIED